MRSKLLALLPSDVIASCKKANGCEYYTIRLQKVKFVSERFGNRYEFIESFEPGETVYQAWKNAYEEYSNEKN